MSLRHALPILLLLAACGPRPGPATPGAPTSSPTALVESAEPTSIPPGGAEPTPTEPTPTPPAASASPTSVPCTARGRIHEGLVPNDGFGRDLSYRIYLPPCVRQPFQELPSLYLLHGLAGSPEQWLEIGVAETADELIRGGEIAPIAILLPWERTGVELEPAIIDGLVPHINRRYPLATGRDQRAIGGLSRGAAWAFRLGLRHPDQFSALGLHSPAVFGGDLFAIERWLADEERVGELPRIWIDIGDSDNLEEPTDELRARLDELEIPYVYHPGEGRHEITYWAENIEAYLRWYAQDW